MRDSMYCETTAGGGRATFLALDREGRSVPGQRAPRKSAIGLAAFMSKVFNE